MLRTVGDQPTLWETLLPAQALTMPAELTRVDELLDDERFVEPFRPFFHATLGRPSIPMETYLRLMFLKHRYRLGFETSCREVTDSITWQRFCHIPLGGTVRSYTHERATSSTGQCQSVEPHTARMGVRACAAWPRICAVRSRDPSERGRCTLGRA